MRSDESQSVSSRSVSRGPARAAGLFATVVSLALLWFLSALTPQVVFPPVAVAELVVRLTPGDIATFFIETLRGWALRLLNLGVGLGTLLVGAELLARTARRGRLRALFSAATLGLVAVAAVVASPSPGANLVSTVVAIAVAVALYAAVARATYDALVTQGEMDPARRRVVGLTIGSGLGLALGGPFIGWLARTFAGPDTDVRLVEPEVGATIPARGPFPDVAGLTPEVTSATDHYVVDINVVKPTIEVDGWTLAVHGEVDNELTLTFSDLQSGFEVVEEYATLACISNEVGGGLVGHSKWGGVRLADVLEHAGVRDEAVDVVFRGADRYSDSIPLELARDPTVLVAFSQNGRPLSQAHGFPCRVRVPAKYGVKNVKWLESIEVVNADYEGYWQQRGWSDDATVRTQSRVDVPGENDAVGVGQETWIAGVAWAGDRGISSVEVSTDGGRTWQEATLKEPIGPLSWRQWAYRWTPQAAGDIEIGCRATDGKGNIQTARTLPPIPTGADGYHFVSVKVE